MSLFQAVNDKLKFMSWKANSLLENPPRESLGESLRRILIEDSLPHNVEYTNYCNEIRDEILSCILLLEDENLVPDHRVHQYRFTGNIIREDRKFLLEFVSKRKNSDLQYFSLKNVFPDIIQEELFSQ